MHYVGVDYHKKTSYVTALDERGQVVKQANRANSKAALEAFFDGDDDAIAVLEAGRTWPVMYDWLEQLLGEAPAGERRRVTLAHPGKARVIAEAKVKTDRIDSLKLAQLLRADLIPMAYVPGRVTREQRRRLRQRMFWARVSTMVKNRIHALVDRYPEHSVYASRGSDLLGKVGRAARPPASGTSARPSCPVG
jgi:hypothetical protein